MPLLPPPACKKPTLVLDLDETLVHSTFEPIEDADYVVHVQLQGKSHPIYVYRRPYCIEFLRCVSQSYEVVLFTASLATYAQPLLDMLDAERTISTRLYREACVLYRGCYVKDLALLGRDLATTVIVDNSPVSYMFQQECALPCSNFMFDRHDMELPALAELLQSMASAADMRPVLARYHAAGGVQGHVERAGVHLKTVLLPKSS